METLTNALPLIAGSYLLNAVISYLLAFKAGLSEKWIAFIPFGAEYLKVKIAGVKETLFTPISILYSSLSVLLLHFSSSSVPVFILGFVAVLTIPMIYIHWKLLEAFLLPGFISIFFLVPLIGSPIYLIMVLLCGTRVAQFYVGND